MSPFTLARFLQPAVKITLFAVIILTLLACTLTTPGSTLIPTQQSLEPTGIIAPPTDVPGVTDIPGATEDVDTQEPSPLPATAVPTFTPPPTQIVPTQVVYPDNGMADWQEYTQAGYGFSFHYPSDWKVEEDNNAESTLYQHCLWVKPSQYPNIRLTITFKRSDEDLFIGRTGFGSGEFFTRGSVLFLSEAIERTVLVDREKDMSVAYAGAGKIPRGDLVFAISLDYQGASSDEITLPVEVQEIADLIVASFELVK